MRSAALKQQLIRIECQAWWDQTLGQRFARWAVAMVAAVLLGGVLTAAPGCKSQEVAIATGAQDKAGKLSISQPVVLRLTLEDGEKLDYLIQPTGAKDDRGVEIDGAARASLHFSAPTVEADAGVVAGSGKRPRVKTTRIVAAASGTKMLVYTGQIGDIFYVFEASGGHVVKLSPREPEGPAEVSIKQGELALLEPGAKTFKVRLASGTSPPDPTKLDLEAARLVTEAREILRNLEQLLQARAAGAPPEGRAPGAS